MLKIISVLLLFLCLAGCSSTPFNYDAIQPKMQGNRYILILEGHNSSLSGSFEVADLDSRSVEIKDSFIKNDIQQTRGLARSKGYISYTASSQSEVDDALGALAAVSNDSTQLLVAMSGECDDKGFIFNLVHTDGANFVPPDKKLLASTFFDSLNKVKGVKAVIISGCQSGCFADAALKSAAFKGVVIAACPVGYATTQCERSGTTAVYAGFLGLYQDDPAQIKNLATQQISAGQWFENFRHKVADIGSGGLPISYDPVKFSTADFLF